MHWPNKRTILAATLVAIVAGGLWWVLSRRQFDRRLATATAALDRGQVEAALVLLEQLAHRSPRDVRVRWQLVRAHLQGGNLESALAATEAASQLEADSERAALQSALILRALGRIGKAEQALRGCLEQNPDSVSAWQQLLDLLQTQLRRREAFDVLERLWQHALQRSAADRAWVLTRRFLFRFQQPKDDEVWPVLQQCIGAEPTNRQVQSARARFRLQRGIDADQAATELADIVDVDPGDDEARASLVMHWLDRGGASTEQIQKLLEGWPNAQRDGRYSHALGALKLRLNQTEEAIAALRAAGREPDNWSALHRLGQAMIRLGNTSKNADQAKIAEGKRLVHEASSRREAFADAAKIAPRLQTWMEQSMQRIAGQPGMGTLGTVEPINEAAAACLAAGFSEEAHRWRELANELFPGSAR